jgi:hypothetical protein
LKNRTNGPAGPAGAPQQQPASASADLQGLSLAEANQGAASSEYALAVDHLLTEWAQVARQILARRARQSKGGME